MDSSGKETTGRPRELSLESAEKIVSSIADESADSVLARANTFGRYITVLERKAFEKVALNIARKRDRTESLSAEKIDGDERITLRVGVDHGLVSDVDLTQGMVGQKGFNSHFMAPLMDRFIQSGTGVEYSDRNSSFNLQFDQVANREQMTRLIWATKWLARNLVNWESPSIIKPNTD